MLDFLSSILSAFALYSVMPFSYHKNSDRFRYIFVPFVGGIIFGISYLWFLLGWYRHFDDVAIALGIIIIAGIITGGRHILGFITFIDNRATYKSFCISWEASKSRGLIRGLLVLAVWFVSMLNTYDYLFPLILVGFIISRIFMGLLSAAFCKEVNSSRLSVVLLIMECAILCIKVFIEYEKYAICPVILSFAAFLFFIHRFKKVSGTELPLLEDDYIITGDTVWFFSVAMVSLINSL